MVKKKLLNITSQVFLIDIKIS